MAINFPNSPAVNDRYQPATSPFRYKWDGSMWVVDNANVVTPLGTVADFTNGGANDLSDADLALDIDGDINAMFRLQILGLSATGANWVGGIRLHTAGGGVRLGASDYRNSCSVNGGTTVNNLLQTLVPMYYFSGFGGLGATALLTGYIDIIGARNPAYNTVVLMFMQLIDLTTLASVRSQVGGVVQTAEDNDTARVSVLTSVNMDSGVGTLTRYQGVF